MIVRVRPIIREEVSRCSHGVTPTGSLAVGTDCAYDARMASGSIFAHLMAGILVLAGACAGQQDTGALDWADYRGPNADGHAVDAAVPLRWSESKNVTFKVRIRGRGWSTPVIGHGRAWLTSARPDGREMSV